MGQCNFHDKIFINYLPITSVISPANMDYVFVQFINCLEHSQEVPVVHRNLSISSLMYDPTRSHDGKPYIVLADLDMADSLNSKDCSPIRAGALPFMACDILDKPHRPYHLRHDLESALYIAIWIVVNYPIITGNKEEQKAKRDILKHWEEGNLTTIFEAKIKFMNEYSEFERITDTRSSGFKPYGPWLKEIWEVFRTSYYQAKTKIEEGREYQQYQARAYGLPLDESSDIFPAGDETLNDTVTLSLIKAAMAKERVMLQRIVKPFIE
ncbi:hypothetical protein C8Q75DRAFT_57911 [Abortiporus biennis]|nr:hypothetical protein C8Q75DRAFT_57911 [Abortiporus biennis]